MRLQVLNYEYDSGEEWEDEGEGESLSDTDGEEEKDGNDLDYDDGWLRYDDDLGSDVDLDDADSSDDEDAGGDEPLDANSVSAGTDAKPTFDPRAPSKKKRASRPATVAERLAKASSRQLQKGFVAGPYFGFAPIKVKCAQARGEEGLVILGKYPVAVTYAEPPSSTDATGAAKAGDLPKVEEPGSEAGKQAGVAAIFQPKCWCPVPVPLEKIWEDRKLDAGNR
eukprot:scaffold1166_cov261-Pinguiococcus_pyrenoidosus.AAC.36